MSKVYQRRSIICKIQTLFKKPIEDQLKTTVNNIHNVKYGTTTFLEAYNAVTVEQNNKKRKIAEDPQTSLIEA